MIIAQLQINGTVLIPSVRFPSLVSVHSVVLESIPAVSGWRRGSSLDDSLLHRKLIIVPTDNFELAVSLKRMRLKCGRKPEHLGGTQARTDWPRVWTEPAIYLCCQSSAPEDMHYFLFASATLGWDPALQPPSAGSEVIGNTRMDTLVLPRPPGGPLFSLGNRMGWNRAQSSLQQKTHQN